MGSIYTGRAYITLSNALISDSSGATINPVIPCVTPSKPYCFQTGSPYVVSITSTTGIFPLEIYPSFGYWDPGSSSVLLPSFKSQFGTNTLLTRDISVYQPMSVLQNTLKRKMNVLIVNDGTLSELKSYVRAGVDVAQNAGHMPESIVVGIPQSGGSCNRAYELLFAQCDSSFWRRYDRFTNPPGLTIFGGCPGSSDPCPPTLNGGGADLYLTWIYTSVLPAVMSKINMSLGEVSIVGGSYGGNRN